jgi:hypothetical protein
MLTTPYLEILSTTCASIARYPDPVRYFACDTEVAYIDVKKESPVSEATLGMYHGSQGGRSVTKTFKVPLHHSYLGKAVQA